MNMRRLPPSWFTQLGTRVSDRKLRPVFCLRHGFNPCNCRHTTSYSKLYQSNRYQKRFIHHTSRPVFSGPDSVENPRLAPLQVTSILRVNELSVDVNEGAVKYFESNQLQSNNPIEDRRGNAKFIGGPKFLFGVFDGHAGCACAQAISERLYYYIALMISPPHLIEKIVHILKDRGLDIHSTGILNWYRGPHDYVNKELSPMYSKSLVKLANEILALYIEEESTIDDHLLSAFCRLDQDIVQEALPNYSKNVSNFEAMQIAFSGSCACVAMVDGTNLYVANTGDCKAVLGVNVGDDQWEAKELSHDHNADNVQECRRLVNSHPNEGTHLIRNGRLLGDLAPLRAFGDVRYKWPARELKHVVKTMAYSTPYGNNLIPAHYHTPPYLTAEPEVISRRLTPKDKFLVLATDGLWEMVTPEKVVKIIAGHMEGKQVHVNFRLPYSEITLSNINQILLKRKTSLANKAEDSNAATHLIRNALGPEHGRVSAMLTLPIHISRLYRDDITVTVIYFDTDYIRDHFHQTSAE
ncbi:pyruvate dehydrogenase [acetyl-transferring]-phosphatase 1, mitochondrial-like [Octopus sinensis]|uniref:Pyruvate dehydrogenase [acetyl-transferring]-phosphatase 1, mitochondrial-like n=1 Tax=Octopus sinensis TaxID=2607531 RepID=A0A6P7SFF5_9MOLL|nr:pyruvate dehydrogenase [acetyl-transferring]-phosphatase 1, mitochondrial-like [Octopus sinensis]